jgi:hypothetical protein
VGVLLLLQKRQDLSRRVRRSEQERTEKRRAKRGKRYPVLSAILKFRYK